jgi:hypothetical protein
MRLRHSIPKNGVKQGGVLSPILFSVIIDALLCRLRATGVGCHLGHVFSGALSYADDVSLLAPSLHSAQLLVDVCSDFANDFQLLFNGAKSQAMVFGNHERVRGTPNLLLNGTPIPLVEEAIHLGHTIGRNASENNVHRAVRDLTIRSNVLHMNYSFVNFDHLQMLFNAYCNCFYGCQFWDVRHMQDFCTCWRKCVRRVFKLNARTHSIYLPTIARCLPPNVTFCKRIISLYHALCKSSNRLLKMCKHVTCSGHSVYDANLRYMMSQINVNYADLNVSLNAKTIIGRFGPKLPTMSDEDAAIALAICELCQCRADGLSLAAFTSTDIEHFLFSLCTH